MFFRNQVKWSSCELDYLKTHTEEPIQQLSAYLGKSRNAIKNKLSELAGNPQKIYKKSKLGSKLGKRKDLDSLFCRSGWEANTCRYFNYLGWKWLYEPKVFTFPGIKHGTVNYCPDFFINNPDGESIWVEVKGFLKSSDKTRIRRFKKFFPEDFKRLRCVVGSSNTAAAKFFTEVNVPVLEYYNSLNKEFKTKLPFWE